MDAPVGAGQRARVSILAALLIALTPLPWLLYALQRASFAGLSRDQGELQGTAWAIAHGARLYRDLRVTSGPLPHEIHLLARLIGGADAHVLRGFDLAVSALVFLFVGSALPGAIAPAPERRGILERLAWGIAACALLLAQYLALYDASQITQRESFVDWFVLAGFGCILRAIVSPGARGARSWLLLAGAASVTPWFSSPVCAGYSALHALAALGPSRAGLSRAARLRGLLLGAAAGVALQLGFLLRYADAAGFVRVALIDGARYYHWLVPHRLPDLVGAAREAHAYLFAIASAALALGLVALRQLGRPLLGLALFPLFGIAADLLSGHAFGESLHPVTAGATLLALVLACQLAGAREGGERGVPAAWLLSAWIGYRAATALLDSPHLQAGFAPLLGATAKGRASAEFLRHYDTADFASAALAEVGSYLQQHLKPSDRIQLYGMDPYLLARAQRQSATPYLYGVDLAPASVLAAIRGAGGSATAVATAQAIAARNAGDFLARFQRARPAALVLFEHAPFTPKGPALEQLLTYVPRLRPVLRNQYRETRVIGLLRVYLRKDLAPLSARRRRR